MGRSAAASIESRQPQLLPDVLDLERVVDGELGWDALEDGHDVMGDHRGHVSQAFLRLRRTVGREHHVGPADQRVARRRRFFREDIGPVTPEPAGVECFGDGRLVHDWAAAGVDQDGVWIACGPGRRRIDHAARAGIEGDVQGDVIGRLEKFAKAHPLAPARSSTSSGAATMSW